VVRLARHRGEETEAAAIEVGERSAREEVCYGCGAQQEVKGQRPQVNPSACRLSRSVRQVEGSMPPRPSTTRRMRGLAQEFPTKRPVRRRYRKPLLEYFPCRSERFELWRRRRDSNPRWPCDHAGFQNRCLQPLGHSSEKNGFATSSWLSGVVDWTALVER